MATKRYNCSEGYRSRPWDRRKQSRPKEVHQGEVQRADIVFVEQVRGARDWQAKAGSFNTERGDSVLVWWPNEMFKTNARISWRVETYDVDTNKTIAEGYFYTEDPSGVEEEEKEVGGIEGRVVVYDMLGRRIKEVERDWEAKMHELSTGIYLVEINGKRRRILILTPKQK